MTYFLSINFFIKHLFINVYCGSVRQLHAHLIYFMKHYLVLCIAGETSTRELCIHIIIYTYQEKKKDYMNFILFYNFCYDLYFNYNSSVLTHFFLSLNIIYQFIDLSGGCILILVNTVSQIALYHVCFNCSTLLSI